MVHLSPRPRVLAELAAQVRADGPEATRLLLAELALYFLIYTGAQGLCLGAADLNPGLEAFRSSKDRMLVGHSFALRGPRKAE